MSEWKEVTIDEIKASSKNAIAMGPFGSRIKADNFKEEGIPIIKGHNLNGDFILEDKFDYLTEEKADELKTSNAFRGDIVITHRGTIGQVGLIPENSKYKRYVVSQSQLKVTLDKEKASPYFIYYFLRSRVGQYNLLMNASQVGVPAIARASTSVKAIKINLPPLPEQKAIAKILGDLDDKIELNRKLNQTLEEMAQALFQSWFVDFDPVLDNAIAAGNEIPEALQVKAAKRNLVAEDKKILNVHPELAEGFPNRFVFNEELGKWIPEGWEVKKVKDLGKTITGKTPSSKTPEHFGNSYPFVTPTDFKNYFKLITTAIRKLSPEGISNNKNRILDEGSILVTCIGSDMGKIAMNKVPCMTNQQINSVIPNKKQVTSEFLYFFFKLNYDSLRTLAFGGSTMPILNKTDFENIDALIPTITLLNKVNYLFEDFDEKILSNITQTETLTKLRDTLLPQLISGKLRVPEAMLKIETVLND